MENQQQLFTNTITADLSLYKEAIGVNSDYYLESFKPLLHKETFLSKWNWPAFLAGPCWALYRKMYAVAFIYGFILSLIDAVPNSNIAILLHLCMSVIFSLRVNVLYFKKITRKIKLLSYDLPYADLQSHLRLKGGVNRWVPYVAIGSIVLGVVVAIAIPQFVKKREHGDTLTWVPVENARKNDEYVTLTPVKNEMYAGLPEEADAMTIYGSEGCEVLGTLADDLEVVSHGWKVMCKADACELEWQVTIKIKEYEAREKRSALTIANVEYTLRDENDANITSSRLDLNNYNKITSENVLGEDIDLILQKYGETITYTQTAYMTPQQAKSKKHGSCRIILY